VKRISLFLLTNIAVIAVMSIVLSLIGFQGYLDETGTNLNLQALLVFSAVLGFAGSFVSLALSKWMAKRATGAQVIESPKNATENWLLATVQRQAREAGIACPEVAIYDSPDPNAFATGMNKNKALVAVSTGLLQSMDQGEVEAVLGHEVSHVANGDMVTLALIQGVVNTFVIFLSRVIGFIVDRVILKNERGLGIGYFVTSIVMQIVLGILAQTIVMWFSRRREFRADRGGAGLAGRDKMIGALGALQRVQNPQGLPQSMDAMGISTGRATGLKRLWMSHPPLEERIRALQQGAQAR
jgi:heat shock protein HtpX